jgi:hypothetical protein
MVFCGAGGEPDSNVALTRGGPWLPRFPLMTYSVGKQNQPCAQRAQMTATPQLLFHADLSIVWDVRPSEILQVTRVMPWNHRRERGSDCYYDAHFFLYFSLQTMPSTSPTLGSGGLTVSLRQVLPWSAGPTTTSFLFSKPAFAPICRTPKLALRTWSL